MPYMLPPKYLIAHRAIVSELAVSKTSEFCFRGCAVLNRIVNNVHPESVFAWRMRFMHVTLLVNYRRGRHW